MKWKYFKAVAVAVAFSDMTAAETWQRAWLGLRLWFGRHEPEVPEELYESRIALCRSCPIFYKKLETCGSPFLDQRLGCFCYMPAKAGLAEAGCWLDEEMGEAAPWGWRHLQKAVDERQIT